MNQFRNDTGIFGLMQAWNDNQSMADAVRDGGMAGLIEQRNRLAVREAQLNTEQHLAAMRQAANEQEWARIRAEKAAAAERERIAALPKCPQCLTPIEGIPRICANCKVPVFVFNNKAFTLEELEAFLDCPDISPALGALDTALCAANRSACDSLGSAILRMDKKDLPAFLGSCRDTNTFLKYMHSQSSSLDAATEALAALEAEHATRLAGNNAPGKAKPYVMLGSYILWGSLAVATLLSVSGAANTSIGQALILLCFIGILVAPLSLLIYGFTVWNAANDKATEMLRNVYAKQSNAERESIETMQKGVQGFCKSFITSLDELISLSEQNDSAREGWLRFCKLANADPPKHMASSTEGPLVVDFDFHHMLSAECIGYIRDKWSGHPVNERQPIGSKVDVVLECAGSETGKVVAVLQALAGLGIEDSTSLVESCRAVRGNDRLWPVRTAVVATAVEKDNGEKLQSALEEAGATVSLKTTSDSGEVVLNHVASCLMCVAMADGAVQSAEADAIVRSMIELGCTKEDAIASVRRSYEAVKQCSGVRDYIQVTLKSLLHRKGSEFANRLVGIMCRVASADGSVGRREQQVIDAFTKHLGAADAV